MDVRLDKLRNKREAGTMASAECHGIGCFCVILVSAFLCCSFVLQHVKRSLKISFAPHGLFCRLQSRYNRHDQCPAEEIAYAVDTVHGQPGGDPYQHFLEAQPEKKSLSRCVQCPEQETMGGAYCHIDERPYLPRHFPGQQHDGSPKDCPYI